MEFYLLTELECDLTIHHPYKTLLALCTKQSGDQLAGTDVEMGELTSTDNVDDLKLIVTVRSAGSSSTTPTAPTFLCYTRHISSP
jgi:hypothetical protein